MVNEKDRIKIREVRRKIDDLRLEIYDKLEKIEEQTEILFYMGFKNVNISRKGVENGNKR